MAIERSRQKSRSGSPAARNRSNTKSKAGTAAIGALVSDAAKGTYSRRIDTASLSTSNKTALQMARAFNDILASADARINSLGNEVRSLQSDFARLKSQHSEVKEEKHLEDMVLSHLGGGMLLINADRFITLINAQASRMLGYEADTTSAGSYKDVLRLTDQSGALLPTDTGPIESAFDNKSEVSITISNEIYCERKNGARFPVTLSVSPVIKKGTVTDVVVIFHDASREKYIDDIKSDFISIAAHQLRTPLTVLNLHTEMLLAGHGGELTAGQREYIQEIDFYNKKMAQLLSDFLTASKIELGAMSADRKPSDLAILLDDVLREARPKILMKRITLNRYYPKQLPLAHTDPTLMRIVFQNVIGNAVKYTPRKGTIAVRVEKMPRLFRISITDSGPGIAADELPHIFNKLYRGAYAKKKDSDGSGLGLYIAKSIIAKCGGEIHASSPVDSGTDDRAGCSFVISLPTTKKNWGYEL